MPPESSRLLPYDNVVPFTSRRASGHLQAQQEAAAAFRMEVAGVARIVHTQAPVSESSVTIMDAVAEEAREIPEVLAAYVSPDGREFVMSGDERTGAVYQRVAEAALRLHDRFAGTMAVDGRYTPRGWRPMVGWFVAYSR